MKFQDWLDERTVEFDDINILLDSDTEYCNTTLDTVKKIYNLLKGTIYFDMIDIVYHEGTRGIFNYYIVISNNLVCMEELIELIRFFNKEIILNNLREEDMRNMLIPFTNKIDLDNKNYYLLTLNPSYYTVQHIEEVEQYLNKDIKDHRMTITELYNHIMYKIKYDKTFKAIISSSFFNFGVVCFDSIDKIDEYKTIMKNKKNGPNIRAVTPEELKDLLDEDDYNELQEIIGRSIPDKDNNTLLN